MEENIVENMEENIVEIEEPTKKPKGKSKKILCIISILLVALAILFVVLAFKNADTSNYYSSLYCDAALDWTESLETKLNFEKLLDDFEKETGLSYEAYTKAFDSAAYKEYTDTVFMIETSLSWNEAIMDVYLEDYQNYKNCTIGFGILSAVCLIGAIEIIIFLLRKKRIANQKSQEQEFEMEEKFLIKSEAISLGKIFKKALFVSAIISAGLASVGFTIVVFNLADAQLWYDSGFIVRIIIYLAPFILTALIGGIFYLCLSDFELTVTDKRIFGNVRKKRVDLPLDSVSAVSMGAFKSISVASSSGRINFSMIKNRNEIHKIVSDLLVERQYKVATPEPTKVESSSADELKKYKDLLDSGVITQEEFDAKKKQLLGL